MADECKSAAVACTSAPALSEPELVGRIKDQLKEMDDLANKIKQTILQQALKLGDLLLQAKARLDHGKFAQWLEKNALEISDRSAQRYMALRSDWPKIEAWCKANSATVADLSLNKAQRIIMAPPNGDATDASDKYDRAEDNLIKKLQALDVDAADSAAEQTIKELRKTVGTMKASAKAA
jgi:Protein of unknown function (DUF3102)